MITNFFKIELPADRFTIQRVPYTEDRLRELRADYNHVASFARYGNFIYVSPQTDGEAIEIGERVPVKVEQHPDLFGSLIRHLLFRTFRSEAGDLVPESFVPLRFASRQPEHDPVREHLPENLQGQLGFPRITETQVRSMTVDGKTQFGLLIHVRHRWRFPVSLAQLHREGYKLLGCTVIGSVPIPGLENVLAPDETLLGAVESIDGDNASVGTNEGTKVWPLASLSLQRSRHQIGQYLAFKLGSSKADFIFRNVRESQRKQAHPSYTFGEVRKLATWFAKQTYANDDGFSFVVTKDSELPVVGMPLEPTRLVFSPTPGASEFSPLKGLSKHGPYDVGQFDRKNLRLLVIFHEKNRGSATEYVGSLIKGIPESLFEKGLQSLFRLHKVDTVLEPIAAHFAEDYEKAIDLALNNAGTRGFDLALVECPTESKSFPEAENPYYRAKARLMTFGIPVQCVTEMQLRAPKKALGYSLGPTALQIYAKLGGQLWYLPSSQSVDHEVIIGIGHSLRRSNSYAGAEQSRIVGLTTFFLGDGRYLFSEELQSVPYAEYFDTLLKNLVSSLNTVSADYAWKKNSTVRIVFHVFKPIKHLEADVVAELIKRYPDYNILFAFVMISTEHPWMMYADAQHKQGAWEITPCERCANLVLDEWSCLLQMRGPNDRPDKRQPLPTPVLVRIHEKSTYKDLPFIAQQVLDFSYMSWRSFFPSEIPVTVFYSEIMAELTAALAKVRNWNPVTLNTHFRRKKWFL